MKHKPQLHASWIDSEAREIVQKLQKDGHTTYLVGGCVRDLLVGIHPKDYDIATNALPQQVKRRIWGSHVIGKRFRLVLVHRHGQQFEVATFRRGSRPEDLEDTNEPTVGDNFFGTPEEDALRRDFTINALFYDPVSEELIDYAQGLTDIKSGYIRMIGIPEERIKEDPIRSLRAIRLAHKLNFSIEESLRMAIKNCSETVAATALPRRREEYLKILKLHEPIRAFYELYDLNLIHQLMPSLLPALEPERIQVFNQYMDRFSELRGDGGESVDLYLPLLLAFSRALEGQANLPDLLDQLMKKDLGMFRLEIAEVMAIFEIIPKLSQIQSFQKRGIRRQKSFLTLPALPRALRISRLELTLTAEELSYWENMLAQNPPGHVQDLSD